MALLLLLVVSVTQADPKLHPYTPTAETTNEVQYDYRYAVEDLKSGVVNDRWEQRYGEYVKGAYSVLEPDGKVRTVDYEVDGPKGFHAVIRTQYPGNKLLSYIQLQKSLKQPHPLVNVLTNQKIETASSEFNNQRSARLHKNLPVNFHSISPNYYLSLVPGQRTNYRNRNLTTASGAFIAVAPDRQQIPSDQFMAHEHHDHNHNHDHSHDHNHELHNHHVQDDNAPGFPGQQSFEQIPRRIQGFAEPSQFMLPPPVGPSVYSQFTEAIPVPQASSTNFRRTYYSGG